MIRWFLILLLFYNLIWFFPISLVIFQKLFILFIFHDSVFLLMRNSIQFGLKFIFSFHSYYVCTVESGYNDAGYIDHPLHMTLLQYPVSFTYVLHIKIFGYNDAVYIDISSNMRKFSSIIVTARSFFTYPMFVFWTCNEKQRITYQLHYITAKCRSFRSKICNLEF